MYHVACDILATTTRCSLLFKCPYCQENVHVRHLGELSDCSRQGLHVRNCFLCFFTRSWWSLRTCLNCYRGNIPDSEDECENFGHGGTFLSSLISGWKVCWRQVFREIVFSMSAYQWTVRAVNRSLRLLLQNLNIYILTFHFHFRSVWNNPENIISVMEQLE